MKNEHDRLIAPGSSERRVGRQLWLENRTVAIILLTV